MSPVHLSITLVYLLLLYLVYLKQLLEGNLKKCELLRQRLTIIGKYVTHISLHITFSILGYTNMFAGKNCYS